MSLKWVSTTLNNRVIAAIFCQVCLVWENSLFSLAEFQIKVANLSVNKFVKWLHLQTLVFSSWFNTNAKWIQTVADEAEVWREWKRPERRQQQADSWLARSSVRVCLCECAWPRVFQFSPSVVMCRPKATAWQTEQETKREKREAERKRWKDMQGKVVGVCVVCVEPQALLSVRLCGAQMEPELNRTH